MQDKRVEAELEDFAMVLGGRQRRCRDYFLAAAGAFLADPAPLSPPDPPLLPT